MPTLAPSLPAIANEVTTTPTRIVTFNGTTGPWFRPLMALLEPQHGLRYREFVDYYYCGSKWCRLDLLIDSDDRIHGMVGQEFVPFDVAGRAITLGFSSNLRAFEQGAGGVLLLHHMMQCDYALIFGGNPYSHKLLDPRRWTTFRGVRQLELNAAYAEVPGEAWWRVFAKALLRAAPVHHRVDRLTSHSYLQDVRVEEERLFTPELLPPSSPFTFRFTPNCDYLNWRYRTDLDFVRYRLFRILRGTETAGYVVLNEQRHRVLVAQADADDMLTLARGILAALSISSTGKRRRQGVVLTAAADVIYDAFRQLGFRERPNARPFIVGSLQRSPDWSQDTASPPTLLDVRKLLHQLRKPDWSDDTSQWLINYDWTENGLRPPFLGQQPVH